MKKILLAFALLTTLFNTSCSSDNDSGENNSSSEPISSITVTSNSSSVDVGTSVILSTVGNNNASVSSTSTFYVNGTQISGRSYTTSVIGTLDIYATHVNSAGVTLTSPTIQVTVNEVINFNKRVLIEDFTGTWCQYCPRVAYAIELIEAETSDVVITAIHRGNDPYNFSGASVLENQIGLSGYPTAMLNRSTEWSYPETSTTAINQALNLTTGINPKLGVALETSTSGNTSTVNVKVKYGKSFNNLKLVVYALEDHLIYNQTNSTTYYGGSNPIVGFEHNHVLRAVLSSSILGETITGAMGYNDEFSKSFTYTIPSSVNASNVRFVAFVVDSTNAALNSRDAGPNETQTFEIE
ncbi:MULTISPECIES: Omp28-related outer membrane protein [unclassified Flavobacterium]|uniref:Omp28-related outer membrane protein n=1 Tax=unclassified Flavobacterium TaxID=196869 RepID=UPI0012918DC7|nr:MULTISPECIES: Omp28-related outer membrane protein [unclassified Flavobacterium]MQP51919.1 Omp28-related outer membrane protein [Flavobacterium sp. LMO9]MQP61788.1 Omp28-related outer membrane protein [Flavobacterium sp. LMO6]